MESKFSSEYLELEKTHWWFLARKEILRSLIHRVLQRHSHLSPSENGQLKILNIGIAGGETSRMLCSLGEVTSIEYDEATCKELAKRSIPVIQADMKNLPFEDASFDIVAAFDVVEHIDDDQSAIDEAFRTTKKGGLVFMTVPAYPILWSNHDEVNHHFRRYTSSRFKELFNGQQIIFSSYFNFLLFPVVAFLRLTSKLRVPLHPAKSDFNITRFNIILKKIFESEKHLLSRFISFPYGVSFMLFARKVDNFPQAKETTQ